MYVGSKLGDTVGTIDGIIVGCGVVRPAIYDGSAVGATVGATLGILEGIGVGLPGR